MKYGLECNGMYQMGLDEDMKPVWTSDITQAYLYFQHSNILYWCMRYINEGYDCRVMEID